MATLTSTECLAELYFHLGLKYREIVSLLALKHDVQISERHLKRILKGLNLARRRYSNIDRVIAFIQTELQGSGRLHGYRMMYSKCVSHGLAVRKEDVRLILRELDPVGVAARLSRRLERRTYTVPGPNFIWHIDGYDKLKPFGLCISGCIDGFSRKIIWLNVYNTNNNPRIIGGYFLESVKEFGGCPCVVRGDYGTENGLVRDFQNLFWNNTARNSSLPSYMDGSSTGNQRIEGWWGTLRRQCLHFWIGLFKSLEEEGHFRGSFLDKNLVLFCFTALIQFELDETAETWNRHNIRPSGNNSVPFGRPDVMFYAPELWQAQDQLHSVQDSVIDLCSQGALFRSAIPCDEDVYEVCVSIMGRDNMDPPKNFSEAIQLYLHLQNEMIILL